MKKLIIVFLIAAFPQITQAQVFVGGLADFEIRKGQQDSAPFINQTPNNNLNIYTPNLRLFGLGVISDNWFVEMTLQADYYEGESLSPIFFSMINVNWMPVEDSNFMITAGRFITPYGLQADRILSSENPFVHLPLSHTFNVGIDNKTGVFSGSINYDTVGMRGQSMIYQRGYSQGIMISNSLDDQTLIYELAATLSPASSIFEAGSHDIPSFTGRISYNPFIWMQLGSSFSYGPFMQRDVLNEAFSRSELRSFRQTLSGADLILSYLYYSLGFEINYSRWTVPDYQINGIWFRDLAPEVWHYSTEFRANLPFLAGSYTAVRYEILRPERLRYNNEEFRFGEEVNRAELAAGYRINRNIRAKTSWLIYSTRPENLEANVFAIQLSVEF